MKIAFDIQLAFIMLSWWWWDSEYVIEFSFWFWGLLACSWLCDAWLAPGSVMRAHFWYTQGIIWGTEDWTQVFVQGKSFTPFLSPKMSSTVNFTYLYFLYSTACFLYSQFWFGLAILSRLHSLFALSTLFAFVLLGLDFVLLVCS